MSFLPLFTTSMDQLRQHTAEIRKGIREANGIPGVVVENFLSPDECAEILRGVYILEPYWRRGTYDGDFILGRSWYTAIDNREIMDYFDEAPFFNQLIRDSFPELLEKIMAVARTLTNQEEVQIRPGWAGPGITIFRPPSCTAETGGSCHIDYDGISKRMVDVPEGLEMFSFMLPISMPEDAAGLYVWPEIYQRFHHKRYFDEILDPEGERFTIPYSVGNLLGIHSLRVHQIEPFDGDIDRVVVTFHLGKLDGKWIVWF